MNYDSMASRIAAKSTRLIKSAAWFPVKTGNLRDMAVYQSPGPCYSGVSTSVINFDASVAPYLGFLEKGTGPHNIPGAFGYPLPFGTSGRFGGMFHPGSVKNKGFISVKSVYVASMVVLQEMSKIGKAYPQ